LFLATGTERKPLYDFASHDPFSLFKGLQGKVPLLKNISFVSSPSLAFYGPSNISMMPQCKKILCDHLKRGKYLHMIKKMLESIL